MTDEEDLDLLVNRFIEVEDKNFALFNFVNEQNNEIENYNDAMQEIKTEIEKFKQQGIELEDQRKRILKELEDKQSTCSKEADVYEKKHTEINKILDQLRRGIESLFNKINCDRSAIDYMLGAETTVTDNNMIQYLGIIEQRTNELLAVQQFVSSKDMERYDQKAGPGLLGEGPEAPQSQLHVMPPSVGDELVYDTEDREASEDDARPLTRNKLQKRVLKPVKKCESAARKEGFRYDLTTNRDKSKSKKDKK